MGVIPGAEITVVKLAPMGDPMELRIHGYELTLRLDDAAKIEIEPLQEKREGPVETKLPALREAVRQAGYTILSVSEQI